MGHLQLHLCFTHRQFLILAALLERAAIECRRDARPVSWLDSPRARFAQARAELELETAS